MDDRGGQFEIRNLDGVGAEVLGVDLAQPMDDATFVAIERAYDDRGMLLFRNQRLTPAAHVAFSRRFGAVEVPTNRQYALDGMPEVYVVSNIVEGGRNIGNADAGRVWHTDSSYMQVPSRGSLLHAIEVPRDADGQPLGDTLFASMTAAYDALPDCMKRRCEGLEAVHDYTVQYERRLAKVRAAGGQRADLDGGTRAKVVPVVHPVIRRHPRTGRPCIYVNLAMVTAVVGMDEAAGLALRDELVAFATQPRFVYRHRWNEGDLVMWDNTSTQHLAIADYALPQRRLMYRTTVAGMD
ncbi:MAG: TauD/TfdA family dioxygenase [Rhodocyclaceae bacterium]|jgi:taurine dioxygenase|nr:TauD/TfdA family dioxygenase [Rhodocyclaceae bacterium]MCA3075769.1 TauD/TfdA family dioxygenase [Rhodocyclaceae bacterium]MCA3091550.1 TauD/TfdA family dioxygenase [Rhodocyclaceae bacterium]MCA3094072.1 TauD/TfdA family dioxygenase [Rhodocyclaceae bacterium]MCA3099137.1 TauD/TfdA family dioxygenase [Rhodocyclaceae bacterium]